ncbi:hypothetical protein [Salinispora sp. H7-4]|uniref:hypothetical protein n=1 Tax=Salinispora sp. H7-4 TaxID=2748321 RepID=UPI0015D11605|nr:hypothetical protein [Salinispora sp. H7-4]NYT92311.1 hypothetical protein [Salinispora sp. H7-4]
MIADGITIELLYRLLGLDEHRSLRALLRAAREASVALPHLVLSVAEHEGIVLGSGSADELRRARHRAAGYRHLLARAREAGEVRVVKGPSLADRYPPGLVRPVGDLDLVVADEVVLWRVVRAMLRDQPVEHIDISVLPAADAPHLMVALSRPADDPLLDRDVKVEVGTMAFGGNFVSVPLRPALPADTWLSDLLSLAEERFQREFTAKDAIDVLVLFGPSQPVADDVTLVASADRFLLAPELSELLTYTADRAAAAHLAQLAQTLSGAVARETTRRDAGIASVDGTTATRPRYGMPLRRVPDRPSWERSHFHQAAPDLTLLRTPVLDALLVADELVDPELYERAQAELALLDVQAGSR